MTRAARIGHATLWALLLLPLTLSPLLGLLTPYVNLVLVIGVVVATVVRKQLAAAYSSYAARAFLAVFVILAILFALTADSLSDWLRTFNFTMLLAYGPTERFLTIEAAPSSVARTSLLASIGVAIGFIEVAIVSISADPTRPSAINLGPIVLSNAVLALGFLALGGVLVLRNKYAGLLPIALILALAMTLLTGSRGPLIAVPFAVLAAALFVWRYRFASSLKVAVVGGGGIVAFGAVGVYAALRGRAGSLVSIFGAMADNAAINDENARQRVALYQAGWKSFLQSPWIGHGWGNIMGSSAPFLPDDYSWLVKLPQLHNDVLNFAVAGGIVGIACYLIILTAPLISAILSPADTLRPFRIYATTTITIVYAGGGLTDLMFGFEFHTFLFVMLNAIVLGYCREAPAGSGA